MSIYHILNGDSLMDKFPSKELDGHCIVFREALMEGPLSLDCDDAYYQSRAVFFGDSYNTYLDKVVPEYEKIKAIPDHSTVYLWFEDDLFCQVNLWYCIHLLGSKDIKLFLVSPLKQISKDNWLGFGDHHLKMLIDAFEKALELSGLQLTIINDCLKLYMTHDATRIMRYVKSIRLVNNLYPLYANVLKAHVKRFSAPGQLSPLELEIKKLIKDGNEDFGTLFKAFSKKFGIYGFGDVQVKGLYDKVINH